MKYLLLTLLMVNTFATELRMSMKEAKLNGFKIVTRDYQESHSLPKNNSLDWTFFERPYNKGFLGNNFAQFQPYSPPGYHGGLDMILEKHSWVQAPISGRLEAGHYTYTDHADGTSTKHWKAWPADGPSAYFEIAVVTEDNLRYELHHIDKSTLPKSIIDKLNSDSPFVEKGERVGKVYKWGTFFHYHHVHLNVVRPNGEHLNPEHFFKEIPDTIAPTVKVLAKYKNKSIWVDSNSKLDSLPESFIVIGHDKKDSNKFNQVPTYFRLSINGNDHSIYDFRLGHYDQSNVYADIREVFPKKVTLPNGKVLSHNAGYYPNNVDFMVELKVNGPSIKGVFEITVSDNSKNETIITGKY